MAILFGENKMSSSIDWFDCPKCCGNAHKEQDTKTGKITYSCSDCDWKGEDVELIRDNEDPDSEPFVNTDTE